MNKPSEFRMMGGPRDGDWIAVARQSDGYPPREIRFPMKSNAQTHTLPTVDVIHAVYRWGSGSYWYVGEGTS